MLLGIEWEINFCVKVVVWRLSRSMKERVGSVIQTSGSLGSTFVREFTIYFKNWIVSQVESLEFKCPLTMVQDMHENPLLPTESTDPNSFSKLHCIAEYPGQHSEQI